MTPQIDNPHDWAVWLLDNLESQRQLGVGHWVGVLPAAFDFSEFVAVLSAHHSLIGMTDEALRTLEFHPGSVKVYGSMQEMFNHPTNLRVVPPRFTLRDIGYTHSPQTQGSALPAAVLPSVANYFVAAQLCQVLPLLSDMTANNGESQHFIKSPESRIEIRLEYQVDELVALKSLSWFESEYAKASLHKDQKRSIVRAVLLEAFKGKKSITVGELLPRFESIIEDVRSNYAMYAAEFSFEKIKAEVEKDNLDSTLKFNKTLSEIQNQLLAMPVALVLVGGQMAPDTGLSIKNCVIWLGALVFGVLMMLLIRNQLHAIGAISEEVRLRKIKVDAQPEGMAGKFKSGFDDLEKRAKTQVRTLCGLSIGVAVSVLLSTVLLIWFSVPAWHKSLPSTESLQGTQKPSVQRDSVSNVPAVHAPTSVSSSPPTGAPLKQASSAPVPLKAKNTP
nr:hypothetical protein [uncultured Rhodoferax sp.]